MKRLLAVWAALGAASAHAHGGHGGGESHWHATDTWGFVALAAAIGAAMWWRHRK